MLKLDTTLAKQSDQRQQAIRESGKYIGTLTRAEKMTSSSGTEGVGLSFRADDGSTADYLDVWHTKSNGEQLSGAKTLNAIMACLKLREAQEGRIEFEAYDKAEGQRAKKTAPGYPAMMNQRIGFLLQKTLETDQHGKDRDRVVIYGVFQADTELTASEVLAKALKPELLTRQLDALVARPVYDKRKNVGRGDARPAPPMDDDSDIPF